MTCRIFAREAAFALLNGLRRNTEDAGAPGSTFSASSTFQTMSQNSSHCSTNPKDDPRAKLRRRAIDVSVCLAVLGHEEEASEVPQDYIRLAFSGRTQGLCNSILSKTSTFMN